MHDQATNSETSQTTAHSTASANWQSSSFPKSLAVAAVKAVAASKLARRIVIASALYLLLHQLLIFLCNRLTLSVEHRPEYDLIHYVIQYGNEPEGEQQSQRPQ